ncbi:MAG TPA: hypothetical protein VGH57_33275 [Amycolatopsis sp.]|jgi:hypothetical protein
MPPVLFALALTGGSLAGLAAVRVEVRSAPLPDGCIAHAARSVAGLSEAIAAWTTRDHS